MRIPIRRNRFALALCIAALALTAGAVGYHAIDRKAERSDSGHSFAPHPVVRCPEVVEVGEAKSGDQVTAAFLIRNDGCAPLQITDIRTGCACVGLERRVGAGYETVRECTLGPGDQAEFALRFAAVGAPGQSMRAGVQFATKVDGRSAELDLPVTIAP